MKAIDLSQQCHVLTGGNEYTINFDLQCHSRSDSYDYDVDIWAWKDKNDGWTALHVRVMKHWYINSTGKHIEIEYDYFREEASRRIDKIYGFIKMILEKRTGKTIPDYYRLLDKFLKNHTGEQ